MEKIAVKEVMEALGSVVSICNMETSRGGNAANQFEIFYENGEMFQSYQSYICVEFYSEGNVAKNFPEKLLGKRVLFKDFDYSNTTNKYRCNFLSESGKETKAKIEKGIYLFCDEA